jgi:two-component system response regulator
MKTVDVKKIFGASVKGTRKLLGVSQEVLAERSDLHRTYISDVERGARNPSLQSIIRLANALEVSVAALFPPELQAGKQNGGVRKDYDQDFVDILLIEDDARDAELTRQAFEQARFPNRIHVVSDGAEALDYLFCLGHHAHRAPAEVPQIVLLDLNLPHMGGLEVLRRIKADERTAMIHVIVLTGLNDAHHIAECQRLGADNYIVKPVDLPGLIQATPQLNLDWALGGPMELKNSHSAAVRV